MLKIPTIEQELDWQIYFAKTNDCKDTENASPFEWISDKSPLTFRSAYPQLKKILESLAQEEEKKLRLERLNSEESKRKKLAFSGDKLNKLKQDRKAGMSIRALANKYNCSTRTIQKYLKAEF